MFFIIKTFLGIVFVLSMWRIGTQYFHSIIVAAILAIVGFIFWVAILNRE